MIKVSIPEKEIQKAIKAIKFYQTETKEQMQKAIVGSAYKVQTDAKRAAAVDTGRLRNSIAVDFNSEKTGAEIGTNVKYAPFIEFGTRYQKARPFLYPAWEAERAKFIVKAAAILKLDKAIRI